MPRDEKGRRVYTQKEIEWVQFIKRLKETGMKLQEIQKYAALRYKGEKNNARKIRITQKHYDIVIEQQKSGKCIYKIWNKKCCGMKNKLKNKTPLKRGANIIIFDFF